MKASNLFLYSVVLVGEFMSRVKKKEPIDASVFSMTTNEMSHKLGVTNEPILKVKANKKSVLIEGVHWIRNSDYYNGQQLLWSELGFQFMKSYFESHK